MTAEIESISERGLITIVFSDDMVWPDGITTWTDENIGSANMNLNF